MNVMSFIGVNSMAISAASTVAKPTVGTAGQPGSSDTDEAKSNRVTAEAELRGGASTQDAESTEKLKKAALQFEAIFVRQLLRNAQFAPKGSHQGFGAMIVDAMADAITEGGGLGLSKQIEQMVAAAHYDADQAADSDPDQPDEAD